MSLTSPKGPIPVTLLSGFLGVGKTTLLEHLLRETKGQRIAVIVNDVNSLNVDGAQIAGHMIKGQEARTELVQLQNGCICCTLRVDLLEEIVRLVRVGKVDAIVIESTGVSEPQQVAETFTTDFTQTVVREAGDAAGDVVTELSKMEGGLSTLAKLDCCVTVVDCFNFFHNFNTFDIVSEPKPKTTQPKQMNDNENNVDEQEAESGTISELLVDQIEFANVIILNKQSMVSPSEIKRIESCVRALNPGAKILHADYGKVDPAEVLNTNLFSMDSALNSAGWLKSLEEMTFRTGFGADGKPRLTPAPETEEFGISSFVYLRRGRPFHPKRLFDMLYALFGITEPLPEEEDYGEDYEDEDGEEDEDYDEDDETAPNGQVPETVLAARKAHPVWSGLLRSKGTFWLATRPYNRGSWSQAGSLLTIEDQQQWAVVMLDVDEKGNATLPDDLVPDPVAMEKIRKDVYADEFWGDRRQEIVFIGERMDKKALSDLLDACLLTPKELTKLKKLKTKMEYVDPLGFQDRASEMFPDPFQPWSNIFAVEEDGDEDDEDYQLDPNDFEDIDVDEKENEDAE